MIEIDWSAPFEKLARGEGFHSKARTITEADVVLFAALTGDNHPQHTDAEWSARSPFGERIAHGMLIISYATGLVPFNPERVIALRRIHDVVFKRPAKLGETIRVEGAINDLTPVGRHAGLVTWRWNIRDRTGQLLCRASIDLLWAAGRTPHHNGPAHPGDLLGLPPGVLPC